MSEPQSEYKTETDEAMAMLGVGYDEKQPSIIIQPKRKATALMESGLAEYDVWGWVKVSANFINHIQKLSGSNLKCWLVVALAIDEFGKCKLTIKQLQLLTKLSHTEVINSTKELEEMGYLRVKRNARGNEYEPVFVARGIGNDPDEGVVKKVESTPVYQVESTPPIEKSHSSIKELKELNGNSDKKPDLLDAEIHFHLRPKAIRDAMRDHFKLTPNWETKSTREWMQWANQAEMTPEQIKIASEVWRSDKRFNWAVPNLKGIQEHWLELIEDNSSPQEYTRLL